MKRLLLIKENQILQVKEFSAFLCMRRCKSLGSLKSFLWHASQPSGASILTHPEFPQGSPAAVWWLLDGRYSFQPWVSLARLTWEGCICWWLWHPLFIDMAENISFLKYPSLGQECDQYLENISWPNFVPQCWEAHPRSDENSCWYATPGANFRIRPCW